MSIQSRSPVVAGKASTNGHTLSHWVRQDVEQKVSSSTECGIGNYPVVDEFTKRMELLERRIMAPQFSNHKVAEPSLTMGSKLSANFDDEAHGSLAMLGDSGPSSIDDILEQHQNSRSHHSFNFDTSTTDTRDITIDGKLFPLSSRTPSPQTLPIQDQSPSLRVTNRLIEHHLRKVGEKLQIPVSAIIDSDCIEMDSRTATEKPSVDDHILVHTYGRDQEIGKYNISNSMPSSVSATNASFISGASNQTLLTGHLNPRTSLQSTVEEQPVSLTGNDGKGESNNKRHFLSPTIASDNLVTNKRKVSMPLKRTLPTVVDNDGKKRGRSQRGNMAITSTNTIIIASTVGNISANTAESSIDPKLVPADANQHAFTELSITSPDPLEPTSLSRSSSSNLPASASTCVVSRKQSTKPPSNNSCITSFFGKASNRSTAKTHTSTAEAPSSSTTPSNQILNENHNTNEIGDAMMLLEKENQSLKLQVSVLEGSLQDKIDQLNAVSNNQTIVHAHLRAQLVQCEKTISSLQDEMKLRSLRTSEVIEQFVRNQSIRQQIELRQQLASDGARLGRLVFNRVGMHSVESWEDGLASKTLKRKRDELRKRKDVIEKKLQDGLNCESTDLLEEDIHRESMHIQLDEIARHEATCEKEDDSLYVEKMAHIKALKRLASEDASRFCSRPKLHDRYVPMYLLGKGGFSEVWLAYDLTDLREVAVKIHQLDPRWSEAKIENYTKHVAREYEIHRDVRHPRIVSLYDVFEIDNNSFATVLEYCKGTDLDTLLKERKMLSERHARLILLQILSGMKYLSCPSPDKSRQGIIHYDLKPGNILFDENGDAKITDFGLSKILDSQDPADSMELTSQGAGTYWYLPPECFVTHENVKISNKVDVWSIGVIFYQMLFGKRPFGDGQSQDKLLSNSIMLNARDVRFPASPVVSDESKHFIQQCLSHDQQSRPNIAEICKHPYVMRRDATPK